MANVLDGRIDYSDVLEMDFNEAEREIFSLRPGDILLSEGQSSELVGRCAVYDCREGEYCFQNTLVRFRPNSGQCPSFYRWLFKWYLDRGLFRQIARQTTSIAHLGADRFARMQCPDVPPDDQQRIAALLDSVEEAIEKTEALIAKTQQLKAGLMHDLFTRGVTPDGQLRPPREEAPHLYRESPLGWIPKGWKVLKLRECLLESPTNGIYKAAEQIGQGTLLVGQAALTEDRSIDFSLSRRAVIEADELRRFRLAEGDILVSRVFATVDGVGQPALVPALPEPAVYESNMMRLRVKLDAVHPRLLFEWLRGGFARRSISASANASNQTSVNQRALNNLLVPSQQLSEQEALLDVIASCQARESAERSALAKQSALKAALMHDLLASRAARALARLRDMEESLRDD